MPARTTTAADKSSGSDTKRGSTTRASTPTTLSLAGNLTVQRSLTSGAKTSSQTLQGAGGPTAKIFESPATDQALNMLGAPGAAIGQNILLSSRLNDTGRDQVLRHELRHVAQVDNRPFDMGASLRLGSHGDAWERAAKGSGSPGAGANPQVLRLYSPGEENTSEAFGECTPDDAQHVEADAATCSLDDTPVLEGSREPLTSMPEEQLSSEPELAVCQQPFADASFDPEAVDVAGMRNDALNAESIQVDAWISDNGYVSPAHTDLGAYRRLQQRLRAERNIRVQTGHLWMTTAVEPAPENFYMLNGNSGETTIISVDPEIATGVPNESFPGPIMTQQQFNDHMAGLGIPILTEEQYVERLRETAAVIAPELLGIQTEEQGNLATPQDRYRGYTGGQGRLDVRVQGISDALPWGSANSRQGEIGEAFALHNFRDRGARAFSNAGSFWNARNRSRVFQPGSFSSYRGPEGLDILRPIRGGWDSTPAVDMQLRQPLSHGGVGGEFDLMSVKTSYRQGANRNSRYKYYLDELGELGNMSRHNLELFRDTHQPGATLEATGSRMGLMIPQSHANDLRDLLRNPTGFETTDEGGQAREPNWAQRPEKGRRTPDRWRMRSHYANAQLPSSIDLGDGQPPLRTGADLLAALRAGRIDQPQFNQHLTSLGESLAGRVFGSEMPDSVVRHYEDFRRTSRTRNARDLRAATPIEVIQIEEEHRRRGGDASAPTMANRRGAVLTVGNRNALRGAGSNVLFSAGANLLFNDNADLSDPRYRQQLTEQLLFEGVANYGADFGETVLRSRLGYEALEEGLQATAPRLVAGRLAARALPGLADAAIEVYGMGSDNRENSTTEVVVRTGRAAVIGAGSAWAGAAAGTAVGGPIGFVVGFGVGFLVGWAANRLAPGGGEYWDRRAAEARRARERAAVEKRRREELERRLAAERARLARLNRPLGDSSASTVGVEGMFGLPTENPMFMGSEPDIQPTVSELEREYILSVLRMAEGGRQ